MTDDRDDLIRQLTIRLRETVDENDRLRAVVAKLTGTDDAHSTLRRLYLDEAQSPGHRIRAAQAALPHEKPRLQPVPPAVDATCEEIIPLAELVEKQRARMDAMLREGLPDIEVSPSGAVRVLPKPSRNGGNGSDTAS
jgi:hypothetical protein